jgi:hypothetical protein
MTLSNKSTPDSSNLGQLNSTHAMTMHAVPASKPVALQFNTNEQNPRVAEMKMRAPLGTEGQVGGWAFSNSGMPQFNGIGAQSQPVRTDSAFPGPATSSTNAYRSRITGGRRSNGNAFPMAIEGQHTRRVSAEGGPPFHQAFLDAREGKRVNHPNTASSTTASHAVSVSASERSSNYGSNNPSPTNEVSAYSSGVCFAQKHVTATNTDLPDLLSGFDQHVASMKSNTGTATAGAPIPANSHLFAGAGGVGESPYITSKSFDDAHRLLGKGLTHLDLPAAMTSDAPKQIGLPLSLGPCSPQVPMSAEPALVFNHQFDRPYSTSYSSDLTTSD